jgi:hypothetical protein
VDDEALGGGGFAKTHVERHEHFAVRLLLAPDQRRRQLQRVGCAKRMNGQQPAGARAADRRSAPPCRRRAAP